MKRVRRVAFLKIPVLGARQVGLVVIQNAGGKKVCQLVDSARAKQLENSLAAIKDAEDGLAGGNRAVHHCGKKLVSDPTGALRTRRLLISSYGSPTFCE